jgi:hypothetical protein
VLSFTNVKAYINLFRGHLQCFECHNVAKCTSFTWDSYGSMRLPMVMQGVSRRGLQISELLSIYSEDMYSVLNVIM